MKKRAAVVVAALIIVAAVLLVRTFLSKKPEQDVLLLSGNVEVTETNVGFKLPGRVIELLTDEGRMVKKGDVIARLDNAELASIVTQNRAAAQEAQTRLAELIAGSRPQEVEQARANVRAQEAELARLKKDFERAEVLYKNGAISSAQFDTSRSAYETRAAQARSAQENLSLVHEGPRKEDIEAARHRAGQASAAVRTAEERLADTIAYAPVTAIVLRKNVELGETISQGTPVFTLGDLANPWIKVYVKEDRLALVKLGQKAKISVDSYPGKTYDGWVSYVSSEAEFTPKTVQTQEERVKLVFAVKVRVQNDRQELKPGMPADVRIFVK